MAKTRPSPRQRSRQALPASLRNGLFAPFPLVYLTPSVPRYLQQLYHLNGGKTAMSSHVNNTICLVSSLTDPLLGTLYMRYCAVFDCRWIEACLVAGILLPPDGFVVWPWDYRGNPKFIPQELFDFDPEERSASGGDGIEDADAEGGGDEAGGAVCRGSIDPISPGPFRASLENFDPLPLLGLTDLPASRLDTAPPAGPWQADHAETKAHSDRGTKREHPAEDSQGSISAKKKKGKTTPLTMYQDPPRLPGTDKSLPHMAANRPTLALTTSRGSLLSSAGRKRPSGPGRSSHKPSDRLTSDKSSRTAIKHTVKHPFHAPLLVSPAPEQPSSSTHTTSPESRATYIQVSRAQDH